MQCKQWQQQAMNYNSSAVHAGLDWLVLGWVTLCVFKSHSHHLGI